MSDKLFDLVEKMYIEFTGNFRQIDKRFESIDQRFQSMDQRINKLEILIENEVLDKIKTLYDDRAEMKEALTSINLKLENLINVVEDHELRIRVLEAGKKVI